MQGPFMLLVTSVLVMVLWGIAISATQKVKSYERQPQIGWWDEGKLVMLCLTCLVAVTLSLLPIFAFIRTLLESFDVPLRPQVVTNAVALISLLCTVPALRSWRRRRERQSALEKRMEEKSERHQRKLEAEDAEESE